MSEYVVLVSKRQKANSTLQKNDLKIDAPNTNGTELSEAQVLELLMKTRV
jgi:hypothetical protein